MHIGMLLNLRNPIPNTLKAPPISNIIHEQNTLRPPKITSGNSPKPFLAGSIPNLQFDSFTVDFDIFDFEVDADGGDEGGGEGIVGVSEEEAGFAHAGIADHEEFALHVVGGWLTHFLICGCV
jgi:hypothetical protein